MDLAEGFEERTADTSNELLEWSRRNERRTFLPGPSASFSWRP